MTTECTDQTHTPAPPSKGACPDCDRPRCNGTTSAGGRCRKQPIKGATVCRTHGGSAPQVLAKAEQRLLERQALLAAETFGLPREVDPHTALLEELHRTAGAVQWLGAIVADLEQEAIGWGVVKETHGTQLERGTDNGTTRAAAVNVFVRLWQEERDRLAKVAKTCVDVGIEERRVRLAESAGQQLAAVLRAVLDRMLVAVMAAVLEVLPDDEVRVVVRQVFEAAWASAALAIVPDELRRLAGDVVPGTVVGGGAA